MEQKILSKKKLQKNVKNSEKYHNKYTNIEKKGKEKNRSDSRKYKYQQKCYKRCRKIWHISAFKQNTRKGKKKKLQNKKYTPKRKYQKIV